MIDLSLAEIHCIGKFGGYPWQNAATPLSYNTYPGGEPVLSWVKDGPSVEKLLVRTQDMNGFMAAMFFLDRLRDVQDSLPELVLPFVPGARQDRRNNSGDFLFTAKSIANLINERNLPKVTILDPHSDVISALIDRCRVHTPADIVKRTALQQPFASQERPRYVAVISPDGGAEKRAYGVASYLGLPLVHGWKKRDVSTGKLSGFGLEPTDPDLVRSGRFLVVDDICDGGGTFIGLGDVLNGRGINADLYVTHGIFSKGTVDLLSYYHRVYCTDSTVYSRPGVTVLPYCSQIL